MFSVHWHVSVLCLCGYFSFSSLSFTAGFKQWDSLFIILAHCVLLVSESNPDYLTRARCFMYFFGHVLRFMTLLSEPAKLSIFSFSSLHELLLESSVWNDSAFSLSSAIRMATNVPTHLGTVWGELASAAPLFITENGCSWLLYDTDTPARRVEFIYAHSSAFIPGLKTKCGLFFLGRALGIHHKEPTL